MRDFFISWNGLVTVRSKPNACSCASYAPRPKTQLSPGIVFHAYKRHPLAPPQVLPCVSYPHPPTLAWSGELISGMVCICSLRWPLGLFAICSMIMCSYMSAFRLLFEIIFYHHVIFTFCSRVSVKKENKGYCEKWREQKRKEYHVPWVFWGYRWKRMKWGNDFSLLIFLPNWKK